MTTKKIGILGLAGFAMACADPSGPNRTLVPASGPSLDASVSPTTVNDLVVGPNFPGRVQVCKTTPAGDPALTWTYTIQVVTQIGTAAPAAVTWDGSIPGVSGQTVCETAYTSTKAGTGLDRVTITEQALPAYWTLDHLHVLRMKHGTGTYIPPTGTPIDVATLATRQATVYINNDMLRDVTFVNNFTTPDGQICDFITFGRLVTEVNGQKVVISGNAGGFNADGSIKGEFHIEVNGVKHHVHDVATYGPIASSPIASSTYTNSRRVTGTDQHGHAVELRLWDGGEPGKDTDRFWFSIGTTPPTVVGNAVTGTLIDQGNMQYHANCRGPDQD